MNNDFRHDEFSRNDLPIVSEEMIIDASPEILALRQARLRALDARMAAEAALREAEQVEAQLRVQEEEAVAAAVIATRERIAEAARVAAEHEREAIAHVALMEAQFQQSTETRERAHAAMLVAAASHDEMQRMLEQLALTLAESSTRLHAAEINERQLASELTAARERADAARRTRENGEPLPAPLIDRVEPSVAPMPVPDFAAMAAQRAAERRAADLARAQNH